ncbi:MAG: acyl-ACP desaturase [Ignavibacteriales bacterium]|nr:acyl-ACP desaturase [Ignavibacteriales bacterium]
MEVLVPKEPARSFETHEKAEVLKELSPLVESLMADHLAKKRMWYPGEFLPADEQMDDDAERKVKALRERARGISDAARVAVALNLLTEEGLPHFHRILATHLGENNIWSKWNFLWTAEEDRHGGVLRDYARDARLFKFTQIEMMQFAYQCSGFTPEWDKDPYKVFVYTSAQERATQIAHGNTGKVAGAHEPTLHGILASVAADEARHYTFYRNVFRALLKIDPNRALQSALAILPSIEMPGLTVPHFKEMADIIRRIGIYGPWDYKKIVDELVEFWRIEVLTGLNEMGRKAQERIMKISERLKKVAEYLDQKTEKKSFSFDFLYGRILVME